MYIPTTSSSGPRPQRWLRIASILILFAAVILLATTASARLYGDTLSWALFTVVLVGLAISIGLVARFFLLARREHRQTASALDATEREYKSVFDNALDGILILDDQCLCLEANPAALTLLGTDRDLLVGRSIEEFFSGGGDFRAAWKRFLEQTYDHDETRVLRADGRTVFVEYTAKANFLRGRHVLVLRDISQRKQAEEHMARNLDMAEAARAEAEAFRKTSLALTQNLSMDYVLDTLLQSLLKLIPCELPQVILVEADARFFLAREITNYRPGHCIPQSPATFDAMDSRFLMEILASRKSVLIADTAQESQWEKFKGFSHLRSWLCVPLVASQEVLGFLSLGDTHAQAFTEEHLRLAKSLAIPAAVAIQNARLYERAEIYGTELEHRLADLEMTQQALRLAEEGRTLSEERFTKVFRSSPIPFSITTLEEGRFVDVNDEFEKRYGYSREQLIGRTASEVEIWDDSSERRRLVDGIRAHGRVCDRLARWRRSSGEVVDTIVSAEAVELDGKEYLLTVSEDAPNQTSMSTALAHKSATTH